MKRIRRRTRNRILGISGTLLVLVFGMLLITGINRASDETGVDAFHKEVMGDAENYGIVAEWINQAAHMDTNFAANYFSSTVNFTVGQYDNNPGHSIATKVGYPTNPNLPEKDRAVFDGKIDGSTAGSVTGGAVLWTSEENTYENLSKKFKVQARDERIVDENGNESFIKVVDHLDNNMQLIFKPASELTKIVNDMIAAVQLKSVELAGKLTEGYKFYWDPKKEDRIVIDISECDENVVYVDASPFVTDQKTGYVKFEEGPYQGESDFVYKMKDFSVKKRKGQTIVLNFAKYTNAPEIATPSAVELVQDVEDDDDTPVSPSAASVSAPNAAKDEVKFEDDEEDKDIKADPTEEPKAEETAAPEKDEASGDVSDDTDKDQGEAEAAGDDKKDDSKAEEAKEETKDEETEEPDDVVSYLGMPSVVKAATKAFNVDVEASKTDMKVQLHNISVLYDEDWNEIPMSASSADDWATNTMKSVIYNIPYAEHVWVGGVIGTVLCPTSNTKFGEGNCAGWLVCKYSYTNCGEWHFCSKKGTTTTTPPAETTTPPTKTTTPPSKTTTPPAKTTTPPAETTTPPAETTTPPVESTTPPVQTTTPPVETTTPPVETTAPPKTTSTPPRRRDVPPPPPVETDVPLATPTEAPTVAPTEAPTATPLTVIDQDVPLTNMDAPEETSLPNQEVPLSEMNVETKPDENVTTILKDVPLSATVPETGDSMNPWIPIAGMGLSLVLIAGIVILRKKHII